MRCDNYFLLDLLLVNGSLIRKRAESGNMDILRDDIAIDNPAITMFLSQGFTEEYRTDEAIILKKEL